MTKIGIIGALGRMGQMNTRQVLASDKVSLSGAVDRPEAYRLGEDMGVILGEKALGVLVGSDLSKEIQKCDVWIDFTTPKSTLVHAALAAEHGRALVVGTTGFSAADLEKLAEYGQKTAIVQSYNFSVGVNLLKGLVEQTAKRLGEDFDIEIIEMHHNQKVDAPSGTAIELGQSAAAGRGSDLAALQLKPYDGHTGVRPKGKIGFATLRGGDVIGDHTVMFAGIGERIELTHKASDRAIFAKGAVRAAVWAAGQKPGFYNMRNVLGI